MGPWVPLFPLQVVPNDAAGDIPEHDIGIGPSVAYIRGPGHGYSLNLDTSYSYGTFTASVNLKLDRNASTSTRLYGPQFELTSWTLLNVGGGAGYLWGTQHGPIVHFFVGFPYGDDILPSFLRPFHSAYIEPYIRTNFFFPQGFQFIFEAGVLLKITTYII